MITASILLRSLLTVFQPFETMNPTPTAHHARWPVDCLIERIPASHVFAVRLPLDSIVSSALLLTPRGAHIPLLRAS